MIDTALSPPAIDVFCRVVDHFGDAGTAWRLCRELAASPEIGTVRLFIDDPATLRQLVPGLPTAKTARYENVTVVAMDGISSWLARGHRPAAVVVEAFACDIPAPYWRWVPKTTRLVLNLEYFSAEPWARECHRRESLLPFPGARKFFFLPGVARDSGGILCHSRPPTLDGEPRRTERRRLLRAFALPAALAECRWAPTYLYPRDLHSWLAALQRLGGDVFLPAMGGAVAHALGERPKGTLERRGNVWIWYAPFLAQTVFDRVVSCSDLLLVRGEDSFAGALLSGRPFLWHLYPQENDHQRVKMEALLAELSPRLPAAAAESFARAVRSLNFPSADDTEIFLEFLRTAPQLAAALAPLAGELRQYCNLTRNMVKFVIHFLKEFSA